MNDLKPLEELRAEIPARRPDELSRARDLLLAEARLSRPGPRGRGRRLADRLRDARHAGLTAIALAVSLVVGVSRTVGHGKPTTPMLTAAYVLDRAAAAATSAQLPLPRPDQFIYGHSVGTGSVGASFYDKNHKLHNDGYFERDDSQIWMSVDGSKRSVARTEVLGRSKMPGGPTPPPVTGSRVQWRCLPGEPVRWTYTFMATLPTDPAKLLSWIYQHKNGQNPADRQAWNDIGDFLIATPLLPPKLGAALFRAAEMVPGATVVGSAIDAAGQHKITVTKANYGPDLVFDPVSYQFVGESWGPSLSSEELQVSVVSKAPPIPDAKTGRAGKIGNSAC